MCCARAIARFAWLLGLSLGLAGCATRSADVRARATDPAVYAGWSCQRLFDEIDRVQARAADVAYAVDARVGNNMIALGLGVTVFWPALVAMRPDGEDARLLADLKGRYEAMRSAAAASNCPPAPTQMAAARARAMPVGLGDRLVYEDRSTDPSGSSRRLGMRVVALNRDHIEFEVDVDRRPLPGHWQQDLVGNTRLDGRAALLGWRRLLQPDMQLGQVVYGDIAAAGETLPAGRVRGQVVAIGPQTLDGRGFDVAVIELFGDAPMFRPGVEMPVGSTRLDGVMAVDRNSGVLLRLELRSANPDYALRRRLVAVERATP